MLHRVIYASEAVGTMGASTLSIAQILGVSEPNNRRDHLTSAVMLCRGHILQVIEGGRNDVDRLMRRLMLDPRHTDLRILSDTGVPTRRLESPITLCPDPATLLDRIGIPCLSGLSAPQAETMLKMSQAA
ncbi:BLUF domain-containing protein [uncultured Brevundimonas sp.]|uniref:BLUF domain-containing protein n=1 Tax=uncultured Brevundimonas sp. TaxID=213418 RepID=UPI0030EE6B89|tara:strand:+ start:15184 stop:15573 length:390 start_codon:yes stop_codon:yes gene_type:complete